MAHNMEEFRSNSEISHMGSSLPMAVMEQDQNVSRDEEGDFKQEELPNSSKHGDHTTDDVQEVLTYVDSYIYEAAAEGTIETFKKYPNPLDLDRLVTPNKNTVLHVYLINPKRQVSVEFVQQLVKLCPSLLMRANNQGEIPLHIAVKKGLQDLVKVLIDESNKANQFVNLESGIGAAKQMLRMMNNEKETALHMAVRRNSLEVVELLTREDSEFLHSADKGETPIYIAAMRKEVLFVMEILNTCKSLDYSGPKGRTALHASTLQYWCDLDIVNRIIDRNPELTKVSDDNGWTPLHYAAYFGFDDMVKLLLEHDRFLAYIPVKDSKMTALHLATLRGDIDSMREIMKRCPDSCELVDKRGWNVFHYAAVSQCYYDEVEARFKWAFKRDIWRLWKELMEYPNLQHLIHQSNVNGVRPYQLLEYYWDSRPPFMDGIEADRTLYDYNWEIQFRNIVELEEDVDIGVGPNGHIRIKKKGWGFGGILSEDELKAFQKANDSHLVVAALIATVTFAAAFTLPGGTEKGVALLRKSPSFQAFIISDALAMVFSTISIFIHFAIPLFKLNASERWLILARAYLTMIAMGAMVLAFVTGTYATLVPSSGLSIAACCIGLSFFVFVLYRVKWTLPTERTRDSFVDSLFGVLLFLSYPCYLFCYRLVYG